jgi:frataxin-like iron-binding protein CyaY
MRKPYLKKLGNFSGFKIWIIDGKYVRDNLNIEFTNFGQSLDFKFIPKNELWIDKEYSGDESRFFLANMLAEYKSMKNGMNFETARKYANLIEKRERANSRLYKTAHRKIKHKEQILKKIHKKLLKRYCNNKVQIWVVNGEIVRDLFFIDFTEGGNDEIYYFIPKGEIWLDDDLSQKERKFVLLHELHERNLMKKGWEYDTGKRAAHFSASRIEHFCRRYPKFLEAKIQNELKKFK